MDLLKHVKGHQGESTRKLQWRAASEGSSTLAKQQKQHFSLVNYWAPTPVSNIILNVSECAKGKFERIYAEKEKSLELLY